MKSINSQHFIPLIGCLLLAACSTPMPNSLPDQSANSNTPTLNEQALFSDLRELDYSGKIGGSTIGVGDVLDVQVFKATELSRQETVNPDGDLTLPLLGDIHAIGMTIPQLEQKITDKLREKYLQNPKVIVVARSRGAQNITLDGSFKSPGIQQLKDTPLNVIQAMALGGGLDDLADSGKVVLFRKTGEMVKAYHLNVDAMKNGQTKAPYVINNDIIIAHRSDTRYWLREVASGMGNIGTILSTFTTYNTIVK
jgi:polysaccharide export outer membrane protein